MVKHVRTVGILVFDGVKMLDVAGPGEVFSEANFFGGNYEVVYFSSGPASVETSIGLNVSVIGSLESIPHLDVLIVPGSRLSPTVFATLPIIDAATLLAAHTDRIAAVCSGAFVLAAGGMLDGRRATTHWKFAGALADNYPSINVEPDAIFVKDGNVYTSGGVAAGMDLALALVEEDFGAGTARAVAQSLLIYMKRPAGQSQYSASLDGPVPRTDSVKAVVDHINTHPTDRHTVNDLAITANISVRHLNRLFRDELDSTPLQYAATIKFDRAKALLDAGHPVMATASAAGFSSSESLRRAFISRLGISPLKYQQRFQTTHIAD